MSRKAPLWAIAAASVVALAGAAAHADSLLSPPGWINGSGNPQDNFTVTTNNGIELGLRAKYRHNPATITPTGTTPTYTVVAGPETNQTSGNNGTSTRTAWNYEYSINLNPKSEASGYLTLSQIFAKLTVTGPNGIPSLPTDILHIPYTDDNTGYGFASDGITPERHAVAMDSDWLAQNSENPSFGNFPVAGFNPYTTGTYTFTLEVGTTADGVLATDTIKVDVVPTPLPSTALAGLGLLGGVGVMGGRRRRHRQPA
jgi:hypothetical protein